MEDDESTIHVSSPPEARDEQDMEALDATDARRCTPTERQAAASELGEAEVRLELAGFAYPLHCLPRRAQVPQCGCTSSHLTLAFLQSMHPLRDRVAMGDNRSHWPDRSSARLYDAEAESRTQGGKVERNEGRYCWSYRLLSPL